MENSIIKTYIWFNPDKNIYELGNNSQYWKKVNISSQSDQFSLIMQLDEESTLEAYHMVNELNIELEQMRVQDLRKVS